MKLSIVAHRGMNGGLARLQGKYQPPPAGIDRAKPENVAKERAIGLGIVAVEKNVRAVNHGEASLAGGESRSKRPITIPLPTADRPTPSQKSSRPPERTRKMPG